jgi:dTDP-4-dehydrorhamnose reductase
MRIVLVGAAGKLGGYLCRDWAGRHEIVAVTRAEVDLRDMEALERYLGELEFDALVNCAAMASPEGCEAEHASATLINAVAPTVMARACVAKSARLMHFSTDYVVDGEEEGLKDESAGTSEFGQYGRSKLAGERRVLDVCPEALVCRVSWIFGEGLPSFLESTVRRARAGEALEAVVDKWSKPTSAVDISRSVERFLAPEGPSGVLHLVNAGEPESWWSYACRVVRLACEVGLLEEEVPVRKMRMAEIPRLSAPRPVHTALTSRRLEGLLGETIPHWEQEARALLRRMCEGECH